MTAPALTWEHVTAWSLRRHHLDERAAAEMALDVASDICGLHAQLMSSAELTLSTRVDGLPEDTVSRALWDHRTLVKTWAMRGTLHLLPAADFPVYQAAQKTRTHFLKGAWTKAFGVSPEGLRTLFAAVSEALDGRLLTRAELADEVGRITGDAALVERMKESWGSLLKPAAYQGLLCFAPSSGQLVRFTRPDTWLPAWEEDDPHDSLLEVIRRYLHATGAATPDELARWWGDTPAAAKRWVRALGDHVATVTVDGATAFALAADVDAIRTSVTPVGVRLLPAFDQFVVSVGRHLDAITPGPVRERIYRPQGWLSPVVLVDGRFVGVWRHETKGKRVTVAVEPFTKLPREVRRRVRAECERFASDLGGSHEITGV